MPEILNLFGFLPFSISTYFNGGNSPHGAGGFYNHPNIYELYFQDFRQLQQNILDMTGL